MEQNNNSNQYVPPQPVPIEPVRKIHFKLIISGVICALLLSIGIIWAKEVFLKPIDILPPVPTTIPAPTTSLLSPYPTLTPQINNNWQTYVSSQNRFSISFPNTWTNRIINVKKGEKFQEGSHEYKIRSDDTGEEVIQTYYDIDINADKADVEYLIISNNPNWQIHVQLQKMSVDSCDFHTEEGVDTFNQEPYKVLSVGNRTLLRHKFEQGYLMSVPGPAGDENIPRPQVIFNKRISSNANNPHVLYLDGCMFDNSIPLLIEITYNSPYFTETNFPEDKMGKTKPDNIDPLILEEMDKIVETIKF